MRFFDVPVKFLPAILILCGVYFLVKLKFFFLLHPMKTAKLMFSSPEQIRELSLSLAGTLGVGNIVGVAVAIILGGSGAVFWMWISAAVSMVLKYAEIVLAVKYRHFSLSGDATGGPMYYMRDGIGGGVGRGLAFVFALLGVSLSFAMGNLVQSGAAVGALSEMTAYSPVALGAVLGVLCAFSIFGGYKSVSNVTSFVVPVMSAVYLVVSLGIVFSNIERLPGIFADIVSSAVEPLSAGGGVMGFLTSSAVRHGVSKGAYSHESGAGTAPLSHFKTKNNSPARQGLLGLFEVFFDTIVMCTITAVVLLLYGDAPSSNASEYISAAFGHFCGAPGMYIVNISVVLFAFSTMICWGFYGRTCLYYLCSRPKIANAYLAIYCGAVALGGVINEGVIWQIADVAVVVMTSVNLCAIVNLSEVVKKETELVFDASRKNKLR